ncbi:MAG: nuclear transport factor 2 family protein [Pyrinomonadaceae bacterium]|nr:nuclear transport factor 2 family protein [Pyrinomonadaceae bacterium]
MSFCIDDGTPLLPVEETNDPDREEETIVSPSAGSRANRESEPAYQPPGGYVPPGTPPGQQGRRKAWPWVVGILAILLLALAGLGIAAATFLPSMLRASNENASNLNANINSGNSNENPNANSNVDEGEKANDNWNADETDPPTSESDVLSTLTDLEHDWTVANINADKKKLNGILADDYVGTTFDGKTQGKADYLRTIERDTSIQKWEFDDLKVSLLGDRASLTGVLRLEVQNQQGQIGPIAFRFTDKFVWRDNRWQAVSSEVKQE